MTVIGTVGLRDFDRGVTTRLCDDESMTYSVDGATRSIYVADVTGLKSGISSFNDKVPVFFADPDAVYQQFKYPCLVVRRNNLVPAFDRASWYGWVGRKPADDAIEVVVDGVTGYSSYENQWRATPFNIDYDVNIFARDQGSWLKIFIFLMRRLKPPSFAIKVVDSLGDIRKYDCVEMNVSDSSELAAMDDRTISSTISFVSWGELDLDDPDIIPSFTGATALDKEDPLYSSVFDVNLSLSVME